MTASCNRCKAPCDLAVLDHTPAPDRSTCPACRAGIGERLAAVPAALRAKAARMAPTSPDCPRYLALTAALRATSDPAEKRRLTDRYLADKEPCHSTGTSRQWPRNANDRTA